jgi:hypothetical protein
MSERWYLLSQPLFYLQLCVLVTAVAGLCGLAIWAGQSKRHWFLRATAIWFGFVALIPIRPIGRWSCFCSCCRSPRLWHGASGAPSNGGARGAAVRGQSSFSQQCHRADAFSLRDLFLATLLVGMTLVPVLAAWRAPGGFSSGWMAATAACLVSLCAFDDGRHIGSARRAVCGSSACWAVVGVVLALHASVLPDWLFLAYTFPLRAFGDWLLGCGFGMRGILRTADRRAL